MAEGEEKDETYKLDDLYEEDSMNERLNSIDPTLFNVSGEGGSFTSTLMKNVELECCAPSQYKSHSLSIDSTDTTMMKTDEKRNILIDSETNIFWTKKDQARLQSLDNLHFRMMQHHNNVHTRVMYEKWDARRLYAPSVLKANLRLAASRKAT